MDDSEVKLLFNYLGIRELNDFTQIQFIQSSYQNLKENPHRYFSQLLTSLGINTEMKTLDEFVEEVSKFFEAKNWEFLDFFRVFMYPSSSLYRAIIEENTQLILERMDEWSNQIKTALLRVKQNKKTKLNFELDSIIQSIQPSIDQVCIYLLKLHTLSIIQKSDVLLQHLFNQFSLDSLYFFQDRFISEKNIQQLQKYLLQLTHVKSAKSLSEVEISTLVEHFSTGIFQFQEDTAKYLITYFEDIPQLFSVKSPVYITLITNLMDIHEDLIIDFAWNYPRAKVRNLALPYFIRLAEPEEIRRYYKEHPSKASRDELLELLVGATSDIYFLELMFDRYQGTRKLRQVMQSLTTIQLLDISALGEFLSSLIDRLAYKEFHDVFLSYKYQRLGILNDILTRLEQHDQKMVQSIRTKLRFVGYNPTYLE